MIFFFFLSVAADCRSENITCFNNGPAVQKSLIPAVVWEQKNQGNPIKLLASHKRVGRGL